ncbi:hypothetical protein KR084_000018, partial [Drosophila pseudotakahashii]
QVKMFRCFLLLLAINSLTAGRVPELEERIIGGSNIEIEQAPWQVSLQLQGQHVCGGSIYSKDIIITAAHCRFDEEGRRLEAEHFQIRAGSALWNYGGKRVNVAVIISHDEFINNSPFKNDIAVLRLSEPLELSNQVQTIPLAANYPARGTNAFASGWGATSIQLYYDNGELKHHKESTKNLQGVRLRINLPGFWISLLSIPQDQIYAGTYGQTICNGDSGGPLVVDRQLVGVVSSGPPFCFDNGVFTSVPYFRNWILDAIKSI